MKKRLLAVLLAAALTSGMVSTASAATHTVVAGDSLSKLAQMYLGSASRWNEIYEANRDKISSPNRIYVGQELVIPGEGETPVNPQEPDEPVVEDDIAATELAVANIKNGTIIGYESNGVSHFYGIPFATAQRFHLPEPAADWGGYLACLMHGEVSPQLKTTMEQFDAFTYSEEMVENEQECLNLNVWSSNMGGKEKQPVVVWLHGGGYTTGGSLEKTFYSGQGLAGWGDVVFVSINHRLNYLGFLDLSAYGEEYKYSGNASMADIIMGLQWVQDNIEVFGGDPDNVTIVGQSGGGSKVTTLMSMPAAEGLFDKAFAMSGGSTQITRTTETAQAETAKVLEILNIAPENIKELETIEYDDLYAACSEAKVSVGPVVDGDYIPTGNYAMSKDVPFITTSVLGEFSTNFGGLAIPFIVGNTIEGLKESFLPNITEQEVLQRLTDKYEGDAALAQSVMDAFKQAYPDHNVAEFLYTNSRAAGDAKAEAMNSYGGTVYQAIQAVPYPMFGGIVPVHTAGDVPLWFHNADMIPEWINGDKETFYRLQDEMAGALVAFAYTGNPSTDALKWEPWTAESDGIMIWDYESGVRYHHDDLLWKLVPATGGGFPF